MRRLKWWFNFLKLAYSRHPSWRVHYSDGGRSYPLRHEDAKSLAKTFGPARIEYCRDADGNLI